MSRLSRYVKEKVVKVLVLTLITGAVAGNGTITVQAEEAGAAETVTASVSDNALAVTSVSGGNAADNGENAAEGQKVAMIEVSGTTAEGTEAEKLLEEINSVTGDYSIYTEVMDKDGHMQSDLAADILKIGNNNEIGGDLGYDYVDRDCYIGDIIIEDGKTLDLGSATGRVIFDNPVVYTDENGVEHFRYTYKDADGNYLTEYTGKNGQKYQLGGQFVVVKTNADGSETVFFLKKDSCRMGGYSGEISELQIVDGEEKITEGLEKIAEAARKLAEEETSEGTKVTMENSRFNIHTEDTTEEVTVANITMASSTIGTDKASMGNQADTVQIYKRDNQVCIINVTVSDATESTVINLQKYTVHLPGSQDGISGDIGSEKVEARENADKVVWNFGDFKGTINLAGSILGRIIAPFAKIISTNTGTGSAVSREFKIGSGEWHSVSTPKPSTPPTTKPSETPTTTKPSTPPDTTKPSETPGTTKPSTPPTTKPSETPAVTNTPTATATPAVTSTPTATPTATPAVTSTPTATPAVTSTPTATPTATATPDVPTTPDDSDTPDTPGTSEESDTPDADTVTEPGTPVDTVTPGTPQVLGARRRRVVTITDDPVALADRAVLGARRDRAVLGASRRPQTGDASDVWNMGFALSLTGLGAWIIIKRRQS